MNLNLLNTRNGGLKRSDSANSARPSIRSNSSYEFHIEPPSNPTSPRGDLQEPPLHPAPPTHPHSPPSQFLGPLHETVPIPPPQPPVHIEPASTSERRQRTRVRISSRGSHGGRDMEARTEPSSPVILFEEAKGLPLGFVPQMFTPYGTPAQALPSVSGTGGGGRGGGGGGGEGEEGEEGESGDGVDKLLVRNTKINATAPLPQDMRKKKKKGGK